MRFDLSGGTTGLYDVVVTRSGVSDSLPNGFQLDQYAGARIKPEILGNAGALGNYPKALVLSVSRHC